MGKKFTPLGGPTVKSKKYRPLASVSPGELSSVIAPEAFLKEAHAQCRAILFFKEDGGVPSYGSAYLMASLLQGRDLLSLYLPNFSLYMDERFKEEEAPGFMESFNDEALVGSVVKLTCESLALGLLEALEAS